MIYYGFDRIDANNLNKTTVTNTSSKTSVPNWPGYTSESGVHFGALNTEWVTGKELKIDGVLSIKLFIKFLI